MILYVFIELIWTVKSWIKQQINKKKKHEISVYVLSDALIMLV